MPKYYARLHGVHSVRVGETGHLHDMVTIAPDGLPRLIVDCEQCAPFLHPMDFSTRPGDLIPTYDEEQSLTAAQAREKRLGPEISEIIARVVAEVHNKREPVSEDSVTMAVRQYLAEHPAASDNQSHVAAQTISTSEDVHVD